jgi:hypothetical protein
MIDLHPGDRIPLPERGFTCTPPWPQAFACAGKRLENRAPGVAATVRDYRGLVAISQSKTWNRKREFDAVRDLWDRGLFPAQLIVDSYDDRTAAWAGKIVLVAELLVIFWPEQLKQMGGMRGGVLVHPRQRRAPPWSRLGGRAGAILRRRRHLVRRAVPLVPDVAGPAGGQSGVQEVLGEAAEGPGTCRGLAAADAHHYGGVHDMRPLTAYQEELAADGHCMSDRARSMNEHDDIRSNVMSLPPDGGWVPWYSWDAAEYTAQMAALKRSAFDRRMAVVEHHSAGNGHYAARLVAIAGRVVSPRVCGGTRGRGRETAKKKRAHNRAIAAWMKPVWPARKKGRDLWQEPQWLLMVRPYNSKRGPKGARYRARVRGGQA